MNSSRGYVIQANIRISKGKRFNCIDTPDMSVFQ